MKRVPEITAEQENFRTVPLFDNGLHPNMQTIRRDSVEPVPVGAVVAKLFRITGYDQDCDGSLMARMENIDASGAAPGWEVKCIGLYHASSWVLESSAEMDRLCE